MKAYLLAAGYATRMYPLTRDRAKPLLEVAGAPILSHILGRVLQLEGLSEVVVISNSRFAAAFHTWAAHTACPVPLRVLDDGSTSEEDRLGALGDLAFALREVPPGDEDALVVAGDNLLGFDLGPVHRAFQETGAPTLVVRRISPGPEPSPYNEVTLDDDGRVTRFREKPERPETDLVALALYFFPPTLVEDLPAYLDAGGISDAPGHFIAWLVQQRSVLALPLTGEWFDIGSLEALEQARLSFRVPAG